MPEVYNNTPENFPPTDLLSEPALNVDMSNEAPTSKLIDYTTRINIAEDLSEEELTKIASKVLAGYEEDKRSCAEWMEQVEEAQKLAKLVKEPKNHPLPKSANIKYPLITNACVQFAARTYPEIVKNGRVVRCAVIGKATPEKEQLAERISKHMSYQLLYETSEWERSLDNLLIMLANIGVVFKKTFFDPIQNRIRSILCNYNEVVVNSNIQELKAARRISHVIDVYLNDLVEGSRSNLYLKDVVDELTQSVSSTHLDESIELIEQHRYLDLDDDGYEEPYIVTLCKKNSKVLRIVARYTDKDISWNSQNEVVRINPVQYFTDFHFLPSPCGKFHSMGFGTLMLHLNETINTILNQLIDSGTLCNTRGGYMDARLKLPSGQSLHDPGEWKRVKAVGLVSLKDGILPIDYKEPSSVLFQLLSLLIQTGKDLSSSTEVLKGTQPAERAPASTVAALIDQGLKEFLAIQRRIFRSLRDEFQKVFRLNKVYLDPNEYITVLDDELAVAQADYENSSIDVLPLADPNLSSDAQRMMQDQALLMIINEPEVDRKEILSRHLETLQVADKDKILPDKPESPNPQLVELQGELENKAQLLNLKERQVAVQEQKLQLEMMKSKMEIMKMYTETMKIAAEAEAVEAGQQLDVYKLYMDSLKTKLDAMLRNQELDSVAAQQLFDQTNADKDRQVSSVPPSTSE